MFKFGGFGIDVKLHSMRNSDDIVWVKGNSYVRVELPEAMTEYQEQYLVHTSNDGKRYLIFSVNGIGEIRWDVNNHYDLNREENRQVAEYFKVR